MNFIREVSRNAGSHAPLSLWVVQWEDACVNHRVFLPASDSMGTTRRNALPLERPIESGLARGSQFAAGVPPRSRAQRRRFEQVLKSNKSDESDDLVEISDFFDLFTYCQKCRLGSATGLAMSSRQRYPRVFVRHRIHLRLRGRFPRKIISKFISHSLLSVVKWTEIRK